MPDHMHGILIKGDFYQKSDSVETLQCNVSTSQHTDQQTSTRRTPKISK